MYSYICFSKISVYASMPPSPIPRSSWVSGGDSWTGAKRTDSCMSCHALPTNSPQNSLVEFRISSRGERGGRLPRVNVSSFPCENLWMAGQREPRMQELRFWEMHPALSLSITFDTALGGSNQVPQCRNLRLQMANVLWAVLPRHKYSINVILIERRNELCASARSWEYKNSKMT